ncbi:hypothetical protein PMZ80_008555 [Knufia obscura]|uniref:Uncharacterized protein n=2 Tax=Knufia TaxID=430999 RepID=A0AAN8I6L5_9EURO|nr:hypothetical protein PMZ80_008555 [Knufia obscura]KAK5952011.1 hypothetical protein OHC33_006897 [Knufia fluminis]
MSTESPSPRRVTQLNEVAGLMLEIYETLAAMRYIDPTGIERGPHNIEALQPVYDEHNLDPVVVYLYSILPYVDTYEADQIDFIFGGEFADYRQPDDVEQGRDPYYANPETEEDAYMRSWVTPLTNMGNHQSVILYDTRKHRIWIVDQEGWSSSDPALAGVTDRENTSGNENSFEHIASRPAGDVLRDVVKWYRTLKIIPGGGEHSNGFWDEGTMRKLYRKHGWPNDFDGDAFEVDVARATCAELAKDYADQPLRKVETYQQMREQGANNRDALRQLIADATNEDDAWYDRFRLWENEQSEIRLVEDERRAKEDVERLCPNGMCQKEADLPLWELEWVRREWQGKNMIVRQRAETLEQPGNDADEQRRFAVDLRHAQKEASLYARAYDAAMADATRLCPGRTVEEVAGRKMHIADDTLTSIERNKDVIAWLSEDVENIRLWAQGLPDNATNAHDVVNRTIEGHESKIAAAEQRLRDLEDQLAEDGNTDG